MAPRTGAARLQATRDRHGLFVQLRPLDAFGRSVGFPGIIAHGMFTMAHVVKAVTDWAGDPGALTSIKVQFRAVVFMDETLVARGEVAAKEEVTRRVRLKVWAEVERAGERVLPIKNSEAEVELA